jgi:capsular polysaccharide biosynthesis protein
VAVHAAAQGTPHPLHLPFAGVPPDTQSCLEHAQVSVWGAATKIFRERSILSMSDIQDKPQERAERAPQPRYGEPGYYPDDEISLVDLWNVLTRRRLVILGIAVLCVAAAIVYSLLATPVYESRTVVLIGKTASIGPVENPDEMVQRLREAYRVGDDTEGEREMPFVEAISLNKREADHIVTISARAETPQEASRFLGQVADDLIAEHRTWYEQSVSVLQERLESLNNQSQVFESQIALIQEEMEKVREVNPVQASVLAVESGKLIAQLPELEERRAQLQLNLLDSRSYPSTLLRAPTLAVTPIHPRPTLYVAIALVLGLMLGIFAAFFAEFLNNARRQTP